MNAPAVTVLLSVYNGQDYVRDAIESVLAQSFRDFELLLIDDASTDATPGILASYQDPRVRVLRNEQNLGLTRSLNAGLRAARGALVARLDADDLAYPERLDRQVAFMKANPDVAALGTQFVLLDERGRRRPLHLWMRCQTSLGIRWQLMFENAFAHSSMMFRNDIVLGLGGYDESFRTNQDFELWSRLARAHPMRNLGETLVALRGRKTSVSASYSAQSIAKVGEVLVANGIALLGTDPLAKEGADALVRLTSPLVHPSPEGLDTVIRWIDRSYARFVQRWPEAKDIPEIRAQAASFIARLATLGANRAPLSMGRWYLQAARYHLPTFARGSLRFVGTSVRALTRGTPAATSIRESK